MLPDGIGPGGSCCTPDNIALAGNPTPDAIAAGGTCKGHAVELWGLWVRGAAFAAGARGH